MDEQQIEWPDWKHCEHCGNYVSSNMASRHQCDKKQLKEREEVEEEQCGTPP